VDTWSDAQLVSLEGHAVKAFLQGYLTCNSDRIEKNTPTPMTLCNLKGRVVANGWALGDDAQVLLVVHRTVADALVAFLKPYAMFSKCKVHALPQAVPVVLNPQSDNTFAGDWGFGAELFIPADARGDDQSATIAQRLIEDRFAWVSEPVAGKFLPQVLGMHDVGAIDFDKGCYLGQEIVARAQFRGAVKRGIDQFAWQGERPVAGDSWEDPEFGKGTVISTAGIEASERGRGLWVRGI
jgi:folate-binding protein YgfZ